MALRILLVLAWSSGFVGAVLGTQHGSAEVLLLWRYAVAAPALLLGTLALRRRFGSGLVGRQAIVGLLCQALYLGGVVVGVDRGVSGGTAALVAAVQPLVVAGIAGSVLGERTTNSQRLGLVVGLVGVTLVVAGDIGGGSAPAWAYLFPVVGMLSLSLGSVLERRWNAKDDVVASLAVQTVVAGCVFAVCAWSTGETTPPTAAGFWWAVLWVVVLSTFGGYGAYFMVLRREGATRVSTLLYLTPPTTAAWEWLMFGTAPGILLVPGLALCAAGVLLTLRVSPGGGARRHIPQAGRDAEPSLDGCGCSSRSCFPTRWWSTSRSS